MIVRAINLDVISNGMGRTRNGALQVACFITVYLLHCALVVISDCMTVFIAFCGVKILFSSFFKLRISSYFWYKEWDHFVIADFTVLQEVALDF